MGQEGIIHDTAGRIIQNRAEYIRLCLKYSNEYVSDCMYCLKDFRTHGEAEPDNVPDDIADFSGGQLNMMRTVAYVVENADVETLDAIRTELAEYDAGVDIEYEGKKIDIYKIYVPYSAENEFLNIAGLVIDDTGKEKAQWLVNSQLERSMFLAGLEETEFGESTGNIGLFRQTMLVLFQLKNSSCIKYSDDGLKSALGNIIAKVKDIVPQDKFIDYADPAEQNSFVSVLSENMNDIMRSGVSNEVLKAFNNTQLKLLSNIANL